MNEAKKVLLGLSEAELKEVARSLGMPAFTGGQIAKWLYQKHVKTIDEMTNLSKQNRERLSAEYCVGSMAPIARQDSRDGTVKFLFPVRCSEATAPGSPASGSAAAASGSAAAASGSAAAASSSAVSAFGSVRCGSAATSTPAPLRYVETVFIPDGDRATLCVSSQVGCKMNCLFCQTGKQGFEGNLTAADILNQIYSLPDDLLPHDRPELLTNVVFMGQGEPMDNLDNVLRATEVLTQPWGYAWSPKRITVSSVGVPSKLKRFLDESQCHVAISMHSPLHEQRLSLMPAEKAMPIASTVELLRQYDFSHQRRCTFEYICFAGLNDSLEHGRKIVQLVKGLDCRVNLIRFHQIPDVDLPGADERRMEQLRDYLTSHGVFASIRASRGQDIFAACGLLSTAKKNE